MAEPYYTLYFNWIEDTQELNDQEKGRLIDAIVLYARGDNWQERIKGNERYVFPLFKGQVDRARGISAKRAEAGFKGGSQKQANVSKGKQMLANDSKCKQNLATSSKIANNNKEKDKEEHISSSSSGNDAHAREDTGAFTGFGAVYSDAELAAMQKQRMEDIPAIERLMRECGYAFSPADETIAIELLNSGETTDGILEAIRIAKEGNALNWRYIKGILKKQKEGSYGTGTDNRRTGTASAGTGYAGTGGGRSQGRGANEPEDDFDRYLKSCHI